MNKDNLSLEERIFILSKTYNAITAYFAHWQSSGYLDLDKLYQSYLKEIIKTDDRLQFGLQMMAFIGHLNNGHSWYYDEWIMNHSVNKSLGFEFTFQRDEWVVTKSHIEELLPGDKIIRINNIAIEDFYKNKKKYIFASSDREARIKLASRHYLFPIKIKLIVNEGKEINIDRNQLEIGKESQEVSGRWLKDQEIGYIKIPSFGIPEYEERAKTLVTTFKDGKALIIDVRGHTGGNTPINLLKVLSKEPLRFWTQATSMTLGRFKADAEILETYGDILSNEVRASMESSKTFEKPSFLWPSEIIDNDEDSYRGKLLILTDGLCRSGGEDFVMPLRDNGSALTIGTRTMGTTGQPYPYDFNNGIRIFIGTTRAYFPDGSVFEGMGIEPQVEVYPNREDLRIGRDSVLERALEIAEEA